MCTLDRFLVALLCVDRCINFFYNFHNIFCCRVPFVLQRYLSLLTRSSQLLTRLGALALVVSCNSNWTVQTLLSCFFSILHGKFLLALYLIAFLCASIVHR